MRSSEAAPWKGFSGQMEARRTAGTCLISCTISALYPVCRFSAEPLPLFVITLYHRRSIKAQASLRESLAVVCYRLARYGPARTSIACIPYRKTAGITLVSEKLLPVPQAVRTGLQYNHVSTEYSVAFLQRPLYFMIDEFHFRQLGTALTTTSSTISRQSVLEEKYSSLRPTISRIRPTQQPKSLHTLVQGVGGRSTQSGISKRPVSKLLLPRQQLTPGIGN